MKPLWLCFLGSLAIDKTKGQPTLNLMRGQQRANFISLRKVYLHKLGARLGAFFKFIDKGTERTHSFWFVRVPPKLQARFRSARLVFSNHFGPSLLARHSGCIGCVFGGCGRYSLGLWTRLRRRLRPDLSLISRVDKILQLGQQIAWIFLCAIDKYL